MKKVVLCLLVVITIASIVICGLKNKEYDKDRLTDKFDLTKENTEIKIKETEAEINQKKEQLTNIKEAKKEEVELAELWKKKVEEIKQYL